MTRPWRVLGSLLSMVCLVPILALGQASRVDWSTFDMGFSEGGVGSALVRSALGQPFAGNANGSNSAVESGFLADTGLVSFPTLGVKDMPEGVPVAYSLRQNYPNPFNPSTSISFGVPGRTHVFLRIYNLLGQLIATLVDDDRSPGVYSVTWDAGNMPSGMYFYRLEAGKFMETKKMVLVR